MTMVLVMMMMMMMMMMTAMLMLTMMLKGVDAVFHALSVQVRADCIDSSV